MLRYAQCGRVHPPTVNLGKIKKKLRREVAAHPAKSAILGILCVVALWFWTPLVWGWVSPRGAGTTVKAAQELGGPQLPGLLPVAIAAADTEPNAPVHSWQQVVQWMEQDPRTQPVGPVLASRGPATALVSDWLPWSRRETVGRDPFFRPQPVETLTDKKERERGAEPSPTPPPVSPRDAGASVTGVIAGPAGGAAMINGRTYLEGEQVHLLKDGVSYAFHLVEIRPGKVVLTRDGTRYELNIPQSASWKTDEPIP